jgi:hypothetical protein
LPCAQTNPVVQFRQRHPLNHMMQLQLNTMQWCLWPLTQTMLPWKYPANAPALIVAVHTLKLISPTLGINLLQRQYKKTGTKHAAKQKTHQTYSHYCTLQMFNATHGTTIRRSLPR